MPSGFQFAQSEPMGADLFLNGDLYFMVKALALLDGFADVSYHLKVNVQALAK